MTGAAVGTGDKKNRKQNGKGAAGRPLPVYPMGT